MEAAIPSTALETLRRMRAQLDAWTARAAEASARADLVKLQLQVEAQSLVQAIHPTAQEFALDLDRGTITIRDSEGDHGDLSRQS